MLLRSLVGGGSLKSTLLFLTLLSGVAACQGSPAATELESRYLATLSSWVARGAPLAELQDTVVGTCGKLIMVTESAAERAAMSTTDRADFDMRVDICTKMTANRAHPQPEFRDTATVNAICVRSGIAAFTLLCRESALPAKSAETAPTSR